MKDLHYYLEEFLSLEANTHHITRYLKFVLGYKGRPEVTEHHHILPKSLFPDYRSLSQNPWNGVKLSPRAHYIAHRMLWKALPNNSRMAQGFWAMCTAIRDGREYKISSRMFQRLRVECKAHMKPLMREVAIDTKVLFKGDQVRRVKSELVQDLMADGWALGNPTALGHTRNTGVVWMKSLEGEHKMFPKADTFFYELLGWVYDNPASKSDIHLSVVGTFWIHKDGKNLRIPREELPGYQAEGWTKGRYVEKQIGGFIKASDDTKQKMKDAARARPRVSCCFCRKEIDVCNFKKLHSGC
uniref:Homing endonuclease n=1 Tax=Pseudomonas phage Cygsa01 TaxID=3138529 RepID=A0AAU6W3K9_9VIRU